jgi:D-proline reductase (dithiol) PrdB
MANSAGTGLDRKRPPIDYIALTRDRYDALDYPPYQWAELTDTPPWTPLVRLVAESTVALIGSGGAYREGQTAFHWKDDTGVRRIPSADPATDIRVTHFAYDLEPARADPNIVFPVDRLREMVDEGVIGGLAPTALGCMGGIYSVRRATEELAPAVVAEITAMDVDLALLVPV